MTEEEAKKEMKKFLLGITADARKEIKDKGMDKVLEELDNSKFPEGI